MNALTSWLNDGAPVVAAELAQKRGEICAQCPLNVEPNWVEKITHLPVAAAIKKMMEIKHDLKIGVAAEKDLSLCKACGCVLRLKIHEPLTYIAEHTSPETYQKLHPACWITTEKNP